MKHIIYLAATALVCTTSLATPAFASKPPINDTTGLTPQQVCDGQLTPAERSEFTTHPEGEFSLGWVNDGAPVQGSPVGPAYGVGTPTYSNVFFTDGFFRNGGSPNVWGGATATETFPQTGQVFQFSQPQTRTTTFDCHVHKNVGRDGSNHLEPPGLQSSGNSTLERRTIDLALAEVISSVPFVNFGTTVYALICISPNNATKGKPGTWTGKHGFDANLCQAASDFAGGSIPSGNAPVL